MSKSFQRKADEAATKHLYRHKFRDWYQCLYCGEPADQRDHVFPVSIAAQVDWSNPRTLHHYKAVLVTVPSCSECNLIAGDGVFASFREKRREIQKGIKARHAKTLRMPVWDDDELEELGESLRTAIMAGQAEVKTIHRRICWPNLNTKTLRSKRRRA